MTRVDQFESVFRAADKTLAVADPALEYLVLARPDLVHRVDLDAGDLVTVALHPRGQDRGSEQPLSWHGSSVARDVF